MSRTQTGKAIGNKRGRTITKGKGRKCTDKPFEEAMEERWKTSKDNNNAGGTKEREVLTPPRKKVKEVEEEIPKAGKRHRRRSRQR